MDNPVPESASLCQSVLYVESANPIFFDSKNYYFPIWELFIIFASRLMRIIARNTLINYWKTHPDSEQPLKSWFDEIQNAFWDTPNQLKKQFRNASIITNKRVVFNIKGNSYRLVVDIEYRIGIVFIVWIGTHKEYDKINVKEIKYVKAD
jgi:mRNA interferase HigB